MLPHHIVAIEAMLLLVCTFMLASQPAYAANVIRLQQREMFVNNPNPGATTYYTIAFKYTTPENIGSIGILFCLNPIPTDPCTTPVGFDASHAILESQTGETGYSILSKSVNEIILTRAPSMTGVDRSSYKFSGIVNPSQDYRSFSARLSTHLSTDASDPLPYVNLGSVLTQTVNSIFIETQVPPILVFCLGQEVTIDCDETSGGWYTDMGTLDPTQTLQAVSQMAVGTNATEGFTITSNGTTMQAGTNVIKPLASPTPSQPGVAQFGINLRANSSPGIGADPDGSWLNANPTPNYNIPNQFMYKDGDVVANSSEVSLQRRFTVSYIANSPPDLRAGVYTTTITFICSGRF
jgi:hypothetical protein